MDNGYVYIIPGDNVHTSDYFFRSIKKTHLDAIQEFSDQYGLGYQFDISQYHDAPCILALDGHLVVKTLEDQKVVLFYLPVSINDNQEMWFENNFFQIMSNYKTSGAFIVEGDKEHIQTKTIGDINSIRNYMRKKNIEYNSKDSSTNLHSI